MTEDELVALIEEVFAEDDEPAWSEPPPDAQGGRDRGLVNLVLIGPPRNGATGN